MTEDVKIWFRLIQDADNYPPFATESVWAEQIVGKGFRLKNVPFCTNEANYEDVVAIVEKDNVLWFSHVVEPSTNSLVRIFIKEGAEKLSEKLLGYGCTVEFANSKLLSVCIPQKLVVPIQQMLRLLKKQGFLALHEVLMRMPSVPT